MGYHIVGIDNNLRGELLGDASGSTQWNIDRLEADLGSFTNYSLDVRDKDSLTSIFSNLGADIKGIVHCAAQTAHEGQLR